MNWQEILSGKHFWQEHGGEAGDVVMSSRVRLARNLVDRPFPARLDKNGQREVLERAREAVSSSPCLAKSQFLDLAETKKVERQFLMERHLISPELASGEGARGVVMGDGQRLTVMINEEDHLRMQSFRPGLSLKAAWQKADQLDNEVAQRLPYAFDSEWGYCTRCPTNVGTGMRASCLVHLPALAIHEDIDRVIDELAQMGVAARGLYGERSKAMGDLFQISNNTSLGQSEKELIETVERVVQNISRYERQSRDGLMNAKHRSDTEDHVFRAWGILRHARLISYDEAMLHLSRVRLGLHMGIPIPTTAETINHLMLLTQPAHLQLMKGSPLKAEERDHWRAAMIREKLVDNGTSEFE